MAQPLFFFWANNAFLLAAQSAGEELSSEIWAMVDGGREGQSGRVWERISIPSTGFWLERYCSLVNYMNDQWVKFSFFHLFIFLAILSIREDKHFLLFFTGFLVLIALTVSQQDFKELLTFHFTYLSTICLKICVLLKLHKKKNWNYDIRPLARHKLVIFWILLWYLISFQWFSLTLGSNFYISLLAFGKLFPMLSNTEHFV